MRTWTLKMTIVVLSVSMVFGMSAAYGQAVLTIETDETIYSDGNKILITTVLQKHSDPPNEMTLIISNPDGGNAYVAQINNKDIILESPKITTVKAQGSYWSKSGEYTVKVKYGVQSAETTFEFVSGKVEPTVTPEPPIVEPPVEPPMDPEPPIVEPPVTPPTPSPQEVTCVAGEVKKGDECVSICGDGTQFIDGQCTSICGSGTEWDGARCITAMDDKNSEKRGGCLIATAAYGTELAPQIQILREIRDNTLMETSSGTSFMTGFNTFYYTFSPAIADWERQSPAFASAVGAFLTPLISTLSIMNLAENTDSSVLALGISVIALNVGIYIGTPIGATYGVRKILRRSRA